MLNAWVLLSALLLAPGVRTFMIYNTQYSLCLHDSKATNEVLLKECSLESESQQWIWVEPGMLMCVASSECLLAVQSRPLQTQSCQETGDPSMLMWDCDKDRLISRNTSMFLVVDGRHLTLSHSNKYSKWKSLDAGDICSQSLRYKRASDNDPKEADESQKDKVASMTEEQKEYLRWYYRTEDPSTWTFVLLGASFLCLLTGFLLLGMGAMANKNRKEIAKYKAAAMAQNHGEELQSIPHGNSSSKLTPTAESPLLANKPSPSNSDVIDLKAGNIVVTWNDGNTTELFPSPPTDDENVATGDKVNTME